jgi:hypothetical protein
MHGVGLAVERARMDARHSRGLREPGRTAGARALQRLWVFAFVSVAWVFFRAESMGNAFAVLWRLIAGLGSIGAAVTLPVVGLVALGIAIQYVPRRAMEGLESGFGRIGWVGQGLVLAAALFLITCWGRPGRPVPILRSSQAPTDTDGCVDDRRRATHEDERPDWRAEYPQSGRARRRQASG